MDDRETRRLEAEADRAELARLNADIEAALAKHGVVVEPRPGFAARRRDRMLRVPQTRSER